MPSRPRPHRRSNSQPRKGTASFLRAPWPPPPVNGYSITIQSPINGATIRSQLPTIQFIPTSVLGDPVDVQVEWRTSIPIFNSVNSTWSPAPTYTNALSALASGLVAPVQPPTTLGYTTWWFRLRAGKSSTNVWGNWTVADRHLDVQAVLGSVSEYIDLNVGVINRTTLNANAYLDMNVGIAILTELDTASQYSDLNVGVVPGWRAIAAYTDLNISPLLGTLVTSAYSDFNITTDPPTPVIWWIRPQQGKEGYVFNIYGHGFGDFENQYNGTVQLGEHVCQISRWERVPEDTTVAHLIKHGAGLDTDQITTEHGWIVAIVPTGAVSAMVKVVLEVTE